ncbi:MAG: restriction endonuclease [Candidatus Pacebacteria bacterium]|nr:restriction endonuclease [Candidatus Paceibacterota bacterium]
MQSSTAIRIRKASGEREAFNPEKLYTSLVRSGADADTAHIITARIADSLHEDDHTRDIYTRAFATLRRLERPMAARYSVKRALLELGPSGFPFEDFLGEIYRALGYNPITRVTALGRCVEHEIDLVAVRDGERLGAEAKFHNNSGLKSDVKVALYVQARFEDIALKSPKGSAHDFTERIIITNTNFTEQAEIYASCAGLSLISWDYPSTGNLRELIEKTHVHPVSCLTSLSRAHKIHLMEQGVVLCSQVRDHVSDLVGLGLSQQTIDTVLTEIKALCGRSE